MEVLFASNNVADWGNNPTTTTAAATHDSTKVPYAIEIDDFAYIPMKGMHKASSTDTAWYHFRIKLGADIGSNEDGYMMDVINEAGNVLARVELQDGKPAIRVYGDTTVTGSYAAVLSSATILDFDIKVTVNSTSIISELYIGQLLVSTATAANSVGLEDITRAFLFNMNDALVNSAEHSFSEFVVAETDTRGIRLTRLDPDATFGNDSAWVGSASNLGDDDPETALTSETAAERTSSGVATLTGSPTIGAVVAMSRAQRGETGPASLKQYLRIGSTNYDGAADTLNVGRTFHTECWGLDPSDSLAWDTAGVNAIEVGLLSVT